MANPRKFSEKIALHNKKQAEETAAFEAVLREVSATTQGVVSRPNGQHQLQQQQYLGRPSDTICHGGSLPDVQFSSNKSINLQDVLQEMKQTELGQQHSLLDKIHRSYPLQEQIHTHRQFNKRRDCSPYSATYLSPPPDTRWRRVHSDSSIHSSTFASSNQHNISSLPVNSSSLSPNVTLFDVTPASPVCQMPSSNTMPQMILSQSYCCDMQSNLRAYPSVEQDSGIHVFQEDDNTGSLPNLNELLLSLAGCPEDYIGTSGHNNIGPMRPNTSQSPDSRHQHTRISPRPLFLPSSSVDHHQRGPCVSQSTVHYRCGSASESGTPLPSPISPPLSLPSYSPPSPGFFTDVLLTQQRHGFLRPQFEDTSVQPPAGSMQPTQQVNNSFSTVRRQSPQCVHRIPNTFQFADCSNSALIDSSSCLHHSQTSVYSNAPMPSSSDRCGFESYDVLNPVPIDNQLCSNVDGVATSQHTSWIPDIVLTGADELLFGQPDHYERDTSFSCNNQMISDVDDLFCLDDDLSAGLNPLELDELDMLSDANMLTDSATEDSFRFDEV